ncbi:hypothetical protein CYY_008522 [Polysphondylium violaceum]|uniref:Rab-GAP TBC domain-containing protein n=1 Tax=Polysphondylium violaceum TaxID=133409 RepID=A0A8J4PLH7_9MYCE|nr:hypothetical protein CYY_008522 [Polysphondylium violaceum]
MFTNKERLEAKKVREIQQCLEQTPIDIEGLRRCSISNFGFVNNGLRRRVWPILLNIDTEHIINHNSKIIDHKDTDQVLKDVERSMWRFTKGESQLRNQKKPELMRIVNAVLSIHPSLYYFQGYHEIASVLLLITDESLAFAMLERLSLNHFNDCMLPNFSEVLKVLNLLFPLISLMDQNVYNFLLKSNVQPLFSISWILTWFSHNVEELDHAARLYDFFLSSHPLACLYFSAALIEHLKTPLLRLECAYDTVHGFFSSNLPQDLPLDKIIQQTQYLLDKFPPTKLQMKTNQYLTKSSPMNMYPYSWMQSSIRAKGKGKKNNSDPTQQIYKWSFIILFGSISIFSILVFLSVKYPNLNLSPIVKNMFSKSTLFSWFSTFGNSNSNQLNNSFPSSLLFDK